MQHPIHSLRRHLDDSCDHQKSVRAQKKRMAPLASRLSPLVLGGLRRTNQSLSEEHAIRHSDSEPDSPRLQHSKSFGNH